MLQAAKETAKEHLARELGLVRRTYAAAEPKQAMFPTTDAVLDAYAEQRAFWITGIAQEAILKDARNFIFQYAKEHPGMSEAGVGFEEGLYGALRKWLPMNDKLGRPINPAFRSETIARTNIMDMYNHARGTIMAGPELAGWVKGYRYSAIIDSATTPLCRHLNGKIFTPQTINGYNPPNHFNALAEGTFIRTRSGVVPIEDVHPGTEVWTHRRRWRKVYTQMGKPSDNGKIRVLLLSSGRRIRITDEHPVLCALPRGGWKTARDLQAGDVLFEYRQEVAGVHDHTAVDPEDFPFLFDEPGSAWPIVRLSPFAPMVFPVDFKGNPIGEKCKVQHISPDGMLENKIDIATEKNSVHKGLVELGLQSKSGCTTDGAYLGDTFHLHRVPLLHSCGVGGVDGACLFAESPSPMGLPALPVGIELAIRDGNLFDAGPDSDSMALTPALKDGFTDSDVALNGSKRFFLSPVPLVDDGADNVRIGQVGFHNSPPGWALTTIISIVDEEYKGNVWNLAVEEDETYLAEDVIVHNCRSVLLPVTELDKGWQDEMAKQGAIDAALKPAEGFSSGFLAPPEVPAGKAPIGGGPLPGAAPPAAAAPKAPKPKPAAAAKPAAETFVKIDFKNIEFTRKWSDQAQPTVMVVKNAASSFKKLITAGLKEAFPGGYYPASEVGVIEAKVKAAIESVYSKLGKANKGVTFEISGVSVPWSATKKKVGGQNAQPKAAAPAAAAPAPASQVVPPPGPPPKLGEIRDVSTTTAEKVLGTKIGEAKGSNPGGTYRGTDGVERYVKFYQDPVQAYNEAVANNIYRALGLEAPQSAIFEHNGKWAIATDMLKDVKGTVGSAGLTPVVARKILDGFSADVLTANWDAVGTGLDNVVVLGNGKVVRIDQGGSLLFRAKAGRKSTNLLETITEIEGFADPWKNPHYAQVFQKAGIHNGEALGTEANRQLAQIWELRRKSNNFSDLVPEITGVPPSDRQAILQMLRKRADFLETEFRKSVHDFMNPPPPPPPVEMTGRNMPTDAIVRNAVKEFDRTVAKVSIDSSRKHGANTEPVSPGEVAKAVRDALTKAAGATFAQNFQNLRAELWGGWKGSAQGTAANMAKYLAERAGITGRTTFTSQYINNDQARRQSFLSAYEKKAKDFAAKYGQDVVDRYALLEYHLTQRLLQHVYGDGPLPAIYRGVHSEWFDHNRIPVPAGVERGAWKKVTVHQNSVSGWSTSPNLSFGGGYKFKTQPNREDIFTTHFLVKGAQSYHGEMEWWYLSPGPSQFDLTRM